VFLEPFLTGRRLITNQTFRDLYRNETVGGNEGIGIKDTTILFTDLKGSTEMYDKIGDLKAFSLVRQHFDRLGKAVFRHAGAVVKTIGDAVMATFNTPAGAVSAALMMLDEIDAFNKEHGDQALILKIGVHHGASIAVTLNDRLDYFGQTVNIAARVQGLAGAEEIYLTEDVYGAAGVKELVARYDVTPELAALKGVAGQVKVFKITEKGHAVKHPPTAPAAKPAAHAKPKAKAVARRPKSGPKPKPRKAKARRR
jgi:class 3 adenylate cyclase